MVKWRPAGGITLRHLPAYLRHPGVSLCMHRHMCTCIAAGLTLGRPHCHSPHHPFPPLPLPSSPITPTATALITHYPHCRPQSQVLAVGGSWLVPPECLKRRDFAEITVLAKAACRAVRDARSGMSR